VLPAVNSTTTVPSRLPADGEVLTEAEPPVAVTEADLNFPGAAKENDTSALVPTCTDATDDGAETVGASGVTSSSVQAWMNTADAAINRAIEIRSNCFIVQWFKILMPQRTTSKTLKAVTPELPIRYRFVKCQVVDNQQYMIIQAKAHNTSLTLN
jgi:hypothetical protein